MALVKVTYTDLVTTIEADNLNEIQDCIIENEGKIEDLEALSDRITNEQIDALFS